MAFFLLFLGKSQLKITVQDSFLKFTLEDQHEPFKVWNIKEKKQLVSIYSRPAPPLSGNPGLPTSKTPSTTTAGIEFWKSRRYNISGNRDISIFPKDCYCCLARISSQGWAWSELDLQSRVAGPHIPIPPCRTFQCSFSEHPGGPTPQLCVLQQSNLMS